MSEDKNIQPEGEVSPHDYMTDDNIGGADVLRENDKLLDEILNEYSEKDSLSEFFEKQTAFGQGFESTADKSPEEIAGEGIAETVNFVSNGKTPVVDSDGMIVIYDSDKGIDATGSVESEIARLAVEDRKKSGRDKKAGRQDEDLFGTDSNMSDGPDAEEDAEGAKDSKKSTGTEKKKKGGFGSLFPQKGDSVGEVIRKCIFLVASLVFLGAGVMLVSTLVQSNEAQKDLTHIMESVTTTVATTIDENGNVETVPPTTEERLQHNESVMKGFIEVSGDVKGFIELPGCDIYYPVVQGTDNDYYLTHTYDNKSNKAGAIFVDYRCTLSAERFSPNIVLYGHNQEDGTMFGNLKYYKNDVEFYKKNPFVTFNTEYGLGDYVIFAYFVTNVYPKQDYYGEVFHYHDYIEELSNRATFRWYMKEVEERNQIIPTVDVKYGDQLLVLSTCSNEYSDSRFVVIARRLREGEEPSDFDFEGARVNPNAKKIDWDAIFYGRTARSTVAGQTTAFTVTTTESVTTTTVSESETTAPATKKKKKKTTAQTETEAETSSETASESAAETETTTTLDEGGWQTIVFKTTSDTSEKPETAAAHTAEESATESSSESSVS